ncbi:MAG: hypothetical protein R3301_14925 [Saprospiraceae bacterium]|nr:hypothetical protein [Saprospiraceae bacterium]
MFLLLLSCTHRPDPGTQSSNTSTGIGVRQFIWQDTARTDAFYGGYRLINAQVWYPAVPPGPQSVPAEYYFRINKAHRQLSNWSAKDVRDVAAVQTNGTMDAPMQKEPLHFPLLVFSPSLGGHLSQYTYYAEFLAQHGYIVIGINHLYESEYVLDTAGTVYTANLFFHDSLKTLPIPEKITADEYRAVKGIRHEVLGRDIVFALDQLLATSFFKDRIDTAAIGVFGHSIGGAAAVYASILDRRFRAVVNLDGTPPTLALENGIAVPFMFIEDLTDYENHPGYAILHARRNNFCLLNQQDSWRILIGGANHNSFLEIHYYLADSPSERAQAPAFLSQSGEYLRTFFSHHLRAEPLQIEAIRTDSLEIIHFRK